MNNSEDVPLCFQSGKIKEKKNLLVEDFIYF